MIITIIRTHDDHDESQTDAVKKLNNYKNTTVVFKKL